MSYTFVDALRNLGRETDSVRYYANSEDGAPARLDYNFMKSAPGGSPRMHGDTRSHFTTYSSYEKDQVRAALASFEAVADVKFTEVGSGADIRFGQFGFDDLYAGYAFYPRYDKATGDISGTYDRDLLPRPIEVWLDYRNDFSDIYIIKHEIGHTLGLKHPFQEDVDGPKEPVLPVRQDKGENTIMSYIRDADDTDLGPFDIIALQSIYGPARTRRGDDTYVFGDDKLIWDGGGEDRITAGDSAAAVSIDLRGGTWNHAGGKAGSLLREGQVFLGYFTEIEHAEGGRFGDRLIGGALGNHLDGGEGADRLDGLGGADRLRGGEGADRLRGGTGRDTLSGARGDDRLEGGAGADALRGGAGADAFVFARPGDSTRSRRDTLFDFDRGDGDVIDLGGLAAKGAALSFVGGGAFSGVAGELRFDHRATEGTRLVLDADGDALPDFVLALEGRIELREADFVL